MFSIEFLLKLINREKVSQYIYTLLLLSLTTIVDFFTLFLFEKMIGIYLYLTIIGSISLLGTFLLIRVIKKNINKLQKNHDRGIYPEREFFHITTLFFASFFIIFPGLISSIIGLILIIPCFRVLIGRKLSKHLQLNWNAVYEYKEIYNQ